MIEEQDIGSDVDAFIEDLIKSRELDKSKIITILQAVQEKHGYLLRTSISSISKILNIPEIDIFGIATFYAQFRFNKPGKYPIRVCEGTACHVRGSKDIVSTIERELHISPGETTKDGVFSMERVACLGCCALAPVIVIDEEIHGQMSISKVNPLLDKFKVTSGSPKDQNLSETKEPAESKGGN